MPKAKVVPVDFQILADCHQQGVQLVIPGFRRRQRQAAADCAEVAGVSRLLDAWQQRTRAGFASGPVLNAGAVAVAYPSARPFAPLWTDQPPGRLP